ncbi:MAG: 1,4-alpha-glucan branching protein domain-containing protein [Candidatus Kapaibacteriota bacterium]
MHNGNFVLILHTHLPFVLHHGTTPHGVDWLNEAVAECYIPLLNVFNDLLNEGIKANVTLDISPVLTEQMEHPDFKRIFINYCDAKIDAAQKDRKDFIRWGYDPHHIWLTEFWENWYKARKEDFLSKYNSSIVQALRELQDKDVIEIMTCGATHGYMPLLGYDKSINLQIIAAKENYKKHFRKEPKGIWLPECAYRPAYFWKSLIPIKPFNEEHLRPGIEQFLYHHNLNYFVTDEQLLNNSRAVGAFDKEKKFFNSILSPYFQHTPWNFDKNPLRLYLVSSGDQVKYGYAAAFTRHRDLSMLVWSGEVGYPGEPDYLDFHKKHLNSMLRYWRVTDTKADMMYKSLYHPDWTWKKIDLQTNHFIHNLENSINYYHNLTNKFATLVTPFDTELFGHWWFEGPEFLRALIRGIYHSPWVNMVKASDQLEIINPQEVISLPEGSWGENNNHDVWMNEENKWTWENIYNDENCFNQLISNVNIDNLDALAKRLMTQTLRELMLLHSSDWQFLIYTKSAKDYAEQRFFFHHSDFNRLCELTKKYFESNSLTDDELLYLEEIEERDFIFPELQLSWWKDLTFPE